MKEQKETMQSWLLDLLKRTGHYDETIKNESPFHLCEKMYDCNHKKRHFQVLGGLR